MNYVFDFVYYVMKYYQRKNNCFPINKLFDKFEETLKFQYMF